MRAFPTGLLEYPQYTRPQEFEGRPIPEILTSGDHARVAAWRRAEAEALTQARRPDLWAAKSRAAKNPQKTRRKGDNAPAFAVYGRQIRAGITRTLAQPARIRGWGAPPMEISP